MISSSTNMNKCCMCRELYELPTPLQIIQRLRSENEEMVNEMELQSEHIEELRDELYEMKMEDQPIEAIPIVVLSPAIPANVPSPPEIPPESRVPPPPDRPLPRLPQNISPFTSSTEEETSTDSE